MHKIKYRLKYTFLKEVKLSGLVLFSLFFLIGTASFPSTVMSASCPATLSCPAGNALIANYPLDVNGCDSSGYSSPMNLDNAPFTADNHLSLNGLYFINCPDTGYYAQAIIPCFNFDTYSFTVSLDFNPTAWGQLMPSCSCVTDNILTGGVTDRWFRIRSDFTTGNLDITLNNDPSAPFYFEHVFPNTPMSTGSWHNVVMSVDIPNKKVVTFLDGVHLDDQHLDPNFILTIYADNNVVNFTDESNEETFYGLANNLKIFSYALTADQIGSIVDFFAITASVSGGTGGTVTPPSQTIAYDATATININPATGYHIASIADNGVFVTIANPYVINNVTVAHNVVVTFAPTMTSQVVGNYVICTAVGANGCPQTMFACNPSGFIDCNTCAATAGTMCGNVTLLGVSFNAGDLMWLGANSFGGGSSPICKITDIVTKNIDYRCIQGINYCFACGSPAATGGNNSPVALPLTAKKQETFELQGQPVLMCADTPDESGCFANVYNCNSPGSTWSTTSLSGVTFGSGKLKYIGGGSDGPGCDVAYFVTTQCIFRCYPDRNNCFYYCPGT